MPKTVPCGTLLTTSYSFKQGMLLSVPYSQHGISKQYIQLTRPEKGMNCLVSLAFCPFSDLCLMNSIKQEHIRSRGYLLWLNNDLICIVVADVRLYQKHLRSLIIPPAWKMLTYLMFSCDFFFTFLHVVLGLVWCLIVSIPDLCLLSSILSRTQTTGDVLSDRKQLSNSWSFLSKVVLFHG